MNDHIEEAIVLAQGSVTQEQVSHWHEDVRAELDDRERRRFGTDSPEHLGEEIPCEIVMEEFEGGGRPWLAPGETCPFCEKIHDYEEPTAQQLQDLLLAKAHRLATLKGDYGAHPVSNVQHLDGCDSGPQDVVSLGNPQGDPLWLCPECRATASLSGPGEPLPLEPNVRDPDQPALPPDVLDQL